MVVYIPVDVQSKIGGNINNKLISTGATLNAMIELINHDLSVVHTEDLRKILVSFFGGICDYIKTIEVFLTILEKILIPGIRHPPFDSSTIIIPTLPPPIPIIVPSENTNGLELQSKSKEISKVVIECEEYKSSLKQCYGDMFKLFHDHSDEQLNKIDERLSALETAKPTQPGLTSTTKLVKIQKDLEANTDAVKRRRMRQYNDARHDMIETYVAYQEAEATAEAAKATAEAAKAKAKAKATTDARRAFANTDRRG